MGASDLIIDLSRLTPDQRAELIDVTDELVRRSRMRFLETLFPDTGPLRRELYPKHLEFFRMGATKQERVFIAGNRVGKTLACGTEWTYHLTGLYPNWWEGFRFTGPIRLLASGNTHDTTRDILQLKMLGGTTDRPENIGTGLVPGRLITGIVARTHVKGAIERATIRHSSGGESELWLRSYEQGRKIFEGFELHGFWPDEECPEDVYVEGQVRLMTSHGISTLTFTPLEGMTQLVISLMNTENAAAASRGVVQCGWDDAPHLDAATKAKMFAKLPPHQRDARTKGIPSLGSGAIYPVPESEIIVKPFPLPAHWARSYGMDVGWNRTAAVWFAIDRDADVNYAYAEHYRGQAEPSIHADAIKARGAWMSGAIDPAARGRSQVDGEQLLVTYREKGLNLTPANNAREFGIYETWMALSTGRLKVFTTCVNWLAEYRLYRRDENGQIVKEFDHAMDATRYWWMTGRSLASTEAPERDDDDDRYSESNWKVA